MNPDPSKLRQQQQQAEQTTALQAQGESQQGHAFNSVEELIRFDAEQSPAPEAIAERLKESIRQEPVRLSWWQRLFRSQR